MKPAPQYELISAERNYTVALHNFNILRGADPALGATLAQGIRDSLPQPVRVLAAEAAAFRPDLVPLSAARAATGPKPASVRPVRPSIRS